ncbi:Peptidoglycan/xylan/chitin deacetylase, PgdA/CDA1 family [Paenibacillus sp. 453mf]|nr:Peptidoglycan/xylan/chitin deacetylase, PgdA/CDA1 family [Paenibacillus sp. 453mf]
MKRLYRSLIASFVMAGAIILIWNFGNIDTSLFGQHEGFQTEIEQPSLLGGFTVVKAEKKLPVIYKGNVEKTAYMTFDDGPSKYTGAILDVLQQHDVEATFFMIGSEIHKCPDAVKRITEEGHYPGMHTMSHNYHHLYKSGGSENFLDEVNEEQLIIQEITGYSPELVRAPFGSSPQIGEDFREDIADSGYKLWDWTIDSLDWDLPGKPKQIISNVKKDVHRDVEVILFHEKEQTLEALPAIIQYLRRKGYKIEAYNPEQHFVMNFSHDTRL